MYAIHPSFSRGAIVACAAALLATVVLLFFATHVGAGLSLRTHPSDSRLGPAPTPSSLSILWNAGHSWLTRSPFRAVAAAR